MFSFFDCLLYELPFFLICRWSPYWITLSCWAHYKSWYHENVGICIMYCVRDGKCFPYLWESALQGICQKSWTNYQVFCFLKFKLVGLYVGVYLPRWFSEQRFGKLLWEFFEQCGLDKDLVFLVEIVRLRVSYHPNFCFQTKHGSCKMIFNVLCSSLKHF